MQYRRFGFAALAVVVAVLASGCQTLTFRAVDAETKAPLPNLRVARSQLQVRWGSPFYFDDHETTTDANGIVQFNSLIWTDGLVFNPPLSLEHHEGFFAVISSVPRWDNGRPSVTVKSFWPEVTYVYWYTIDSNRQRRKATVRDGVIEIPVPKEGKQITTKTKP